MPWRCAKSMEKHQDLPRTQPRYPWVLNSGASQGPAGQSHALCERGLSQICPVIRSQLDPSIFLLSPGGWNWLEMFQESFCLCVCFWSHSFAYWSPVIFLLGLSWHSPRSTLRCFFSSLEYIWRLCRCDYLEDTDKFRVIRQNLFSAPKSKCTSLIHIYIDEYT